MTDLRAQLGDDDYQAMMRGIARGKYQALLGAGASATSRDSTGAKLPGGAALRDDMITEFSLPADSSPTLKRVYHLAKSRTSRSNESVGEYLRRRFTNTQPAEWHKLFLKLQWKQLWTLNIDDCLEVASTKLANQRRQQLLSVSWTEKHRQADARKDELLLIHLHGKANRGTREDELIFDISSYTNALTSQHRWLKIFGDEFPANPFIVVGASLDEEIDLQSIFEEGRITSSAEYPSIIILRSISEFQRAEYASYGLSAIASTTEDFFEAIHTDLHTFIEDLAPEAILEAAGTSAETLRFLGQWKSLGDQEYANRDKNHDIFLGHEPRWSDALQGRISTRLVEKTLTSTLTQSLAPGSHAVVLASGESFSGKSSLVLQSCRGLIALGYMPFIFSGEQAVDADALFHWLQRVPKTVLVIDDAADFARDIQDILEDERFSDVNLRVVLVERLSKSNHIASRLIAHRTIPVSIPPRLQGAEIASLVELLTRKKRLGVLTTLNASERKTYFEDHDRKLFSAMAALEDGRGFRARVTEEFDRLSSKNARRLLTATALANRLGYGLPLDIVKTATGLTARQVEVEVNDHLGDLLSIEKGVVSSRHKIFGELLVVHLSPEERLETIVDVALAVAPHVSPAAISDSTLHYRIARSLMGRAMLLELLGNHNELALTVFERLESAYEWNARYWEQRALTAANSQRFEPAFSWAQQAVAKRRDSYSLNTIGVVLMQRAVYEAESGEWPTDTFEKAHDYLEEARKLEGDRAEYPIETFFTYVMRLIQKVPERDRALNSQIAHLWATWYSAILNVDAQGQLRLAKIKMEASETWDRAELARYR